MTALVYVHPYNGAPYRVPAVIVDDCGDMKLVKFREFRRWCYRAYKPENIYLKPL